MAWSIRGEYFENCHCEALCVRTTRSLAGPADNERCNLALICHIDKTGENGHFRDVARAA